jgi:hypothetical protein
MPRHVGAAFSAGRRERKYDFGRMGVTDGQVWLLERGRDYQCTEANLRQHARRYAQDHGLQFATVVKRERGKVLGVEIAFAPHGAELPSPSA